MRRFAVGLTVVAATCLGCEDCELSPPCPISSLGVIEGRLMGAGSPVPGAIHLEPIGTNQAADNFHALADSNGRYEIVLPRGDYRLYVSDVPYGTRLYYAKNGFVYNHQDADTVHVGAEPLCIDFSGAALQLDARIIGEWPSYRLYGRLWRHYDGSPQEVTRRSEPIEDGRALICFPMILPGTYRIAMDVTSGQTLWLSHATSWERADSILVTTENCVIHEATCGPLCRIEGVVSGSWRSFPYYSRPRIALYSANDSTELSEVTADQNGEYVSYLVETIPIKLLIEIEGIKRWVGGVSFDDANSYLPIMGETVVIAPHLESGIACRLRGPGLISDHYPSFRLVDSEHRTIYEGHGEPLGGSLSYFANLSAGIYYLYVRRRSHDQPWHPQWYDRADSLSAATPITISEEGEIVEVTVALEIGGEIHGRVLRSSGEPLQYASLVVRSADGSFQEHSAAETDPEDGSFRITGMANGAHFVGVRFGWDDYNWYPGTWEVALADTIWVENCGITEGIEWQAPY